MSIVREVADAFGIIAGVVRNTRDIIGAINDGTKYLKLRHPDALPGFEALVAQIQVTIEGLASVTRVVSGFRFVVDDTASARVDEAARFNDYVYREKKHLTKLRGDIHTLKGSCDTVRKLRDELDSRVARPEWGAMFDLLGSKDRARAAQLASALSGYFADDQRLIEAIGSLLDFAETAIADVEETLGPPGQIYPQNVPAAASVLGVYAQLFREPQAELDDAVRAVRDAHSALSAR